jgi:catechol 2,3-dioxygenase-like lactoylglutathione lyase family enzyme
MSAPAGPSGPIREINAVTLATADMAASVGWYRALDFVVAAGGPHEGFTTLRAGTGFLNLQFDPEHRPPNRVWGRVILWVDDVDAAYRRAVDAGMEPEAAPVDAPWGERYFHLRDPSGHELSFAQPLV